MCATFRGMRTFHAELPGRRLRGYSGWADRGAGCPRERFQPLKITRKLHLLNKKCDICHSV